jgi:hypothetical protein
MTKKYICVSALANGMNKKSVEELENEFKNLNIINPSKKEADYYLYLLFMIDSIICERKKGLHLSYLKNEVMNFFDNTFYYLDSIKTELQNVSNGTATEEDYNEFIWQKLFKNTPDGFIEKFNTQVDKAIKEGMLEEGGWDNL